MPHSVSVPLTTKEQEKRQRRRQKGFLWILQLDFFAIMLTTWTIFKQNVRVQTVDLYTAYMGRRGGVMLMNGEQK